MQNPSPIEDDINKKRGVYIALENLFALECPEHEKTFQVIIEIFREALDQHLSDNSNLSFVRLRLRNLPSRRSDCLGQVVTQLCPSLYDLWITEKELLNPDLLCFVGHLKELRALALSKEARKEDLHDITDILFNCKLVPLLEITGKSLRSLHVEISVDISVIIKLCPNLTFLSLFGTHFRNSDMSMTKFKLNHFPIMEEKQLVWNELKCLCCGPKISPDSLFFYCLSPP